MSHWQGLCSELGIDDNRKSLMNVESKNKSSHISSRRTGSLIEPSDPRLIVADQQSTEAIAMLFADKYECKIQITSVTVKEHLEARSICSTCRKARKPQTPKVLPVFLMKLRIRWKENISRTRKHIQTQSVALTLEPIYIWQWFIKQLQILNIDLILIVANSLYLEIRVSRLPSLQPHSIIFLEVLFSDLLQQMELDNNASFWLMLPLMKTMITWKWIWKQKESIREYSGKIGTKKQIDRKGN